MILFSILGAIFYRMRGGWPSLPRPIEQCLFCIPIIIVSLGSPLAAIILAFVLSVAAVSMGHGHTMSLLNPVDLNKLERYEFFTKWLIGKMPDYWYKVLAHSFGGLLVTLPLIFTNPMLAPIGLLKGPAYMIGWRLHPNYYGNEKIKIGKITFDSATAVGEGLTGLFIWAALLGGLYV